MYQFVKIMIRQFSERFIGRDRMPGPVATNGQPDPAELWLRLHVQPGGDPRCRRPVLPAGVQAPALDGVGCHGPELCVGGGVFMAAALEYLTMEILDLAGQCADEHKKKQIKPRHIQLAVRNDEELNRLLSGVTIAQGGVLPNIQAVLLPKKSK